MKKLITGVILLTSVAFFGQNTFPSTGAVTLINSNSSNLFVTGTGTGTYAGGYMYLKANGIDSDIKHVSTMFGHYKTEDKGTFVIQRRGHNQLYNGNLALYQDGRGWEFSVAADNDVKYPGVALKINANKNVGIGTTTPESKLSLYGSGASGWNSGIELNREGGGKGWIVADNDGMKFRTPVNGDGFYFRDNDNNTSLLIKDGGNVVIGSAKSSDDSKLAVEGKIHCEEVQVDLDVAPDYVFEKYYTGASDLKEEYTMPTLEEIEAYTKENHHLPSIPSAKEIKEEGLHLKEMTSLLLQKIEELTLYTIEQEKRINALEGKLATEK